MGAVNQRGEIHGAVEAGRSRGRRFRREQAGAASGLSRSERAWRRTACGRRLDAAAANRSTVRIIPVGADTTQLAENPAAMLQKTVSEVLGNQPPVAVDARVAEGNAAKVLIDLSDDAELLVVGSRGYGGFPACCWDL